jgi:ribosomal protein S18 acetylase RimI-like enzyme
MGTDHYARPVMTRRAVPEDAARIADIHVQSRHREYQGQPQDVLDSLDPTRPLPHWPTILKQAAWPRRGTLVAEDAHKLLGFSNLCPSRDDDDPTMVGEITSFYVLPETWGKGVGRRLMTASLAAFVQAGYTLGILWVLNTNTRAIRFYEVNGWRPDGAVKSADLRGVSIQELRYHHELA